MVLFIIDCEIMHAWHICVLWRWLKTWKLERRNRVLKRKLRATQRERMHVPRKTGDGLAETAGALRWVPSELVPTENPGHF